MHSLTISVHNKPVNIAGERGEGAGTEPQTDRHIVIVYNRLNHKKASQVKIPFLSVSIIVHICTVTAYHIFPQAPSTFSSRSNNKAPDNRGELTKGNIVPETMILSLK